MEPRIVIKTEEPRVYEVMGMAEKTIKSFGLDPRLIELIKIRASQINNCGYCLDMHTRDARKAGETEQRLFTLSAWWETDFFTETEQAAIRLTEEVTRISENGVSDEVYQLVLKHFGTQGFAQLILVINTINSWNRIAISTHMKLSSRSGESNSITH